jgi:hypothetical protein
MMCNRGVASNDTRCLDPLGAPATQPERAGSPNAVQRMLGQGSAAMTLDVSADLFEDHLDEVAVRLDHGLSAKDVA